MRAEREFEVRSCRENPLESSYASGVVENSVGCECKEGSDLYYSGHRTIIEKRVVA